MQLFLIIVLQFVYISKQYLNHDTVFSSKISPGGQCTSSVGRSLTRVAQEFATTSTPSQVSTQVHKYKYATTQLQAHKYTSTKVHNYTTTSTLSQEKATLATPTTPSENCCSIYGSFNLGESQVIPNHVVVLLQYELCLT